MIKYRKIIFKGRKNKSYRLWDLPIPKKLRHIAHEIITIDKTKTELIQYIYVGCFSPTPRKFLKAIKNRNFLTWPVINTKTLSKHLPLSIATALGHLEQELKNLYSTKQVKSKLDIEEDKDLHPEMETVKTNELCVKIIPLNTNRNSFSYLTGAFPHKSIRVNLYVIVLYGYDSNTILDEPIKTGRQQPSAMIFSKCTRY